MKFFKFSYCQIRLSILFRASFVFCVFCFFVLVGLDSLCGISLLVSASLIFLDVMLLINPPAATPLSACMFVGSCCFSIFVFFLLIRIYSFTSFFKSCMLVFFWITSRRFFVQRELKLSFCSFYYFIASLWAVLSWIEEFTACFNPA